MGVAAESFSNSSSVTLPSAIACFAGFALLIALSGVFLGPHGSRFLELVIAEPAPRQGRLAHRIVQPRSHPFQGSAAQFEIAVLDFRIERVPEILDQPAQQAQTLLQPGETLLMQERLGEPGGQLQIFGLRGQRLAGQLDHQLVVGDFALALPLALRRIVILAAGFLDLVVDRSVAEIGSAGVVAWDRVKQIVAQGHGVTSSKRLAAGGR